MKNFTIFMLCSVGMIGCGANGVTSDIADTRPAKSDAGASSDSSDTNQIDDRNVIDNDSGSDAGSVISDASQADARNENDSGTTSNDGSSDDGQAACIATACAAAEVKCGPITACGGSVVCPDTCAAPYACQYADLNDTTMGGPGPGTRGNNTCGLHCENSHTYCTNSTGAFIWYCANSAELQSYINTDEFKNKYVCESLGTDNNPPSTIHLGQNTQKFCCSAR